MNDLVYMRGMDRRTGWAALFACILCALAFSTLLICMLDRMNSLNLEYDSGNKTEEVNILPHNFLPKDLGLGAGEIFGKR